jgi:hypothetical protein
MDDVDKTAMAQAATVHVNSVDHDRLVEQVRTAANKAQRGGDTGVADRLVKLADGLGSRPQALKDQLIAYITPRREVLQYFPREFARGITEKL